MIFIVTRVWRNGVWPAGGLSTRKIKNGRANVRYRWDRKWATFCDNP
jgi:hypothetical protein